MFQFVKCEAIFNRKKNKKKLTNNHVLQRGHNLAPLQIGDKNPWIISIKVKHLGPMAFYLCW